MKIIIKARLKPSREQTTTDSLRLGSQGLRCLNAEQSDGQCLDYEIRTCCKNQVRFVIVKKSNFYTSAIILFIIIIKYI